VPYRRLRAMPSRRNGGRPPPALGGIQLA